MKDIPWAKRWAWAPDAMKRNGKYYFYVTADDQVGVGVSDKPYGPFEDPLGKPLIARGESGTRVMDPAIFVDDDGQAYLYFGQNAARVVKLKEDMVTRDGGAELVRAARHRRVPRVRPRRDHPAGGDDEGGRAGEEPALEAVTRGRAAGRAHTRPEWGG